MARLLTILRSVGRSCKQSAPRPLQLPDHRVPIRLMVIHIFLKNFLWSFDGTLNQKEWNSWQKLQRELRHNEAKKKVDLSKKEGRLRQLERMRDKQIAKFNKRSKKC